MRTKYTLYRKYFWRRIPWFTLIEILVSITILSIIMVSVIMIFINSTEVSSKSEINRLMQENIKNVVETIAEDVRKNWITWTSNSIIDDCDFDHDSTSLYKNGNKLCTWLNDYYLAKEVSWTYTRIDNSSSCTDLTDSCIIVKNGNPLTNSYVSIKKLDFYVSNDYVPKVTINITLQPAVKKWVKPELIKKNKIIFQTTVRTRSY